MNDNIPSADFDFYAHLASNMPLSGSMSRENRWESGMQHSLSVHMCKIDGDTDACIDDFDVETEFHPLDDSSSYEELDENIGGPIRTDEHRELLRIWNRILSSHNLSMHAGRMKHDRVPGPPETPTEHVADFAPLIEAALTNAPVASATARIASIRIHAIIEIDRVCQHVVGIVANTGPGPDFVRRGPSSLPRHAVVHTW